MPEYLRTVRSGGLREGRAIPGRTRRRLIPPQTTTGLTGAGSESCCPAGPAGASLVAMLTRAEVAQLLQQQSWAYELLLWLGRACADDPALLDAGAARQLGQAWSVPDWIARHRHRIPADLVPAAVDAAFAALLASFLETSFRIEHVSFGDRLVATHLVRGVNPGQPTRRGVSSTQALTLKHLLSAEGLAVTDEDVRAPDPPSRPHQAADRLDIRFRNRTAVPEAKARDRSSTRCGGACHPPSERT